MLNILNMLKIYLLNKIFIYMQSALHVCGFCFQRFNQLQNENAKKLHLF
jgi:hypothetical protein